MMDDNVRRLTAIRSAAEKIANDTEVAAYDEPQGMAAITRETPFALAHRRAAAAVSFCDEGNLDTAAALLAEARAFLRAGLADAADPRKLQARLHPARRGARSKKDRNAALFLAASPLMAADSTMSIAAACRAALTRDEVLARAFGFGVADRTLERAFRSGQVDVG